MITTLNHSQQLACPVCSQIWWTRFDDGRWNRDSFGICNVCRQVKRKEAGAWLDGWDACLQSTK